MRHLSLYREYASCIIPDLFFQSSGGHGIRHTKRVLYLAGILSWRHSLSDSERKVLALACCYHDIGRIHDETDDNHGGLSSQKVADLYLLDTFNLTKDEQETILKLIIFHSVDDSLFQGSAREKLLYQILKDADALDRVRFLGLNPSYLRLPLSKLLIPLAFVLLLII